MGSRLHVFWKQLICWFLIPIKLLCDVAGDGVHVSVYAGHQQSEAVPSTLHRVSSLHIPRHL